MTTTTRSYPNETLRNENLAFRGTGGISEENRGTGFVPAFRDATSGRVYLSRFGNGGQAPIHLHDALPPELFTDGPGQDGRRVVRDCVISGFVRDGLFYTRAQAAFAAG